MVPSSEHRDAIRSGVGGLMTDITDAERSDLLELLQRVHLSGIYFHELSCRQASEVNDSQGADVAIDVQTRTEEDNFGVRALLRLQAPPGDINVQVAAEYDVLEGEAPNGHILSLFASEIAMMALFPYLREAVQDLSAKVFGEPIILPIVQRGGFRQDAPNSEKQS